ncbi:hypothetical protein [Methylocapsa sp. S129]|uniref:hypothetical protein n=1 Tax=Methylocapsa sp. S129 TaxID=1641869 RepID=UPI00131B7E84|nr:hypothetical protein [Methylocapsa sp. S129]
MQEKLGLKGPTASTIKRLFALSSNRCAFRHCTCPLIVGETVVGEVCHIKAASRGGPRYDNQQTADDRHGFANLILMCGPHHTIVDDNEEAFTVEFLTRRKTEHESNPARLDEQIVDKAMYLFLNQTVSSTNQSGGITANTVNTEAIHFNSLSVAAPIAGTPDWTIQDLFLYLRSKLDPAGPTALWDEAAEEVLDKLSSGQLQAWGREISRGVTTSFRSLAAIDATYWRAARFTFVFLLDGHERDVHVNQIARSALRDYSDLHVNREKALELWPHPQLGSWSVQNITLAAHYLNKTSDQLTIPCKTITLFDAHIETIKDAGGAASYRRFVAPAYLLATGIDSSAAHSLQWAARQLSFIDLKTNSKKIFYLGGLAEAPVQSRRVKFLLEPQEGVTPQPVSPDTLARAAEFFAGRAAHMNAGIDVPAVLRRGPKLVLRVVPLSGLEGGRDIEHAAPRLLGHLLSPDGFEKYEDRTRKEGWTWRDPPTPIGLPNPVSWWHSRLDWNGYVEVAQTLFEETEERRAGVIRGHPLERAIVCTLDAVCDAYQKLQLRSPAFVQVELIGVLGLRIAKSTAGHTKGFDRPFISTEVLDLIQMARPLGVVLRSTLDTIWRAAGWPEGSPSFSRSDWEGYANPHPYQLDIALN